MKPDRRHRSIIRDINALIRDDNGGISLSRVGLLLGQGLAVTLILENGADIIANWDSLLVLFMVLVAPDAIRKVAVMKYNGDNSYEPRYRSQKGQSTTRDLSRE